MLWLVVGSRSSAARLTASPGGLQGFEELKRLKGEYGQHMTKLKVILAGLNEVL